VVVLNNKNSIESDKLLPLLSSLAIEFPGCSNVKGSPALRKMMHRLAALFAIYVSLSTLSLILFHLGCAR
jgi:hypothetical protein